MNYINNFAVDVFTRSGHYVGNWPSLSACVAELGLKNVANARACLNNKIKFSEGYVFKRKPTEVVILEGEVWRPVTGYEELYAVSNKGRVASLKAYGKENFKIMKLAKGSHGYKTVQLSNNNITKNHIVHRLVAEAFIPNPNKKEQVDHIDTIIENNCVENLRWVTSIENHHNPITLERHKRRAKEMFNKYGNELSVEARRVPVQHITDNGTVFYSSYSEAGIKTGHSDTTIRKWCINNKNGWSKIKND